MMSMWRIIIYGETKAKGILKGDWREKIFWKEDWSEKAI